MAKTIAAGFEEFLKRLTPTKTETRAAKDHRASIEQCLRSNFGLISFFRSGSFGNATSISGYSDVDYFAWIPYKEVPSTSSYFLTKVRNALDNRFPRTGVRVDSPAVVVPFGSDSSETTEVVPARYKDKSEYDTKIFDIADGSGGWLPSSPLAHSVFVQFVDKKFDGKVRPLIRFVKAWKYYSDVPIQSFYLELFIANYALTQKTIFYIWDLDAIFRKLWNEKLPAIKDPIGVSGLVIPCKNNAHLEEVKFKVLTAHGRVEKAQDAYKSGNIADTFYWLRMLYDNRFPAYG